MQPRRFLTEFVCPAVAAWRLSTLDIRLATVALCELDNMAEHYIQHTCQNLDRDGVRKQRDRLCAKHIFTALARDVHDTHKHGRLSRKNALIKKGQRPQKAYAGGTFDSGIFDAGVFDVGTPILQIEQDDGLTHDVGMLIETATQHWMDEITRAGL